MALAAPLLRLFFFVVLLLVAVKSTEIARSEAAKLPENEVAALKAVATKLGKRNWNFSVDPCSGSGGWTDSSKNNVTCDCSYANRTVCHIVSIQLSEQNLTGVLPDELSKLTHLSILYLAYNYINGTIPTSWSSLPLVTLVLSGNRLSGQIPKELGNITTLEGLGYLAPEYATRGHLTDKADVFSFGVVALEIITGRSNAHAMPKEDFAFLLDWAFFLQEKGSLLELVDPRLGSDLSEVEALRMLNISLLCTSPSPSLRPTMSCVVDMLEGRIPAKAPTLSSTLSKASLSSAWRFSNPYLSSISKASEFSAGLHSSGYGTYAGSSDSSANKMDTGGSCSITEKNL